MCRQVIRSGNGGGSFTAGTINRVNQKVLDGLALDRPKVYGVCGLAVGDIMPNSVHAGLELVVGSLDGHLLVYALDQATGQIGTLLYQTRVEGSVGAYNSIVIADLDNNNSNEVYVAGSLGLRKWIFQ